MYFYLGDALHQHFVNMNWTDPAVKAEFNEKLNNSTYLHRCINRADGKIEVCINLWLSVVDHSLHKLGQ